MKINENIRESANKELEELIEEANKCSDHNETFVVREAYEKGLQRAFREINSILDMDVISKLLVVQANIEALESYATDDRKEYNEKVINFGFYNLNSQLDEVIHVMGFQSIND